MSVSSFQDNQFGGDRHGKGSAASSRVETKDLELSNRTNTINNNNNNSNDNNNNENNKDNNDNNVSNQRSRGCTQKGL